MTYSELPLEQTDQPAPQRRGLIPVPRFLQTRAGHIVVAIASAAVLLPIAAVNGRSNHVELVQPIGLGVEALAIALGILIGVVLAEAWTVAWRQGHMMFLSRLSLGSGVTRTGHNVRSDARASRSLSGWLLMLVLVVGAVLTATRLAREVVMWRAFVGVTAVAVPEPFTIVGKVREGRRTRAHLEVRLATGGRTFNVRVSADAFASARLGATLSLPVETGRGGIQRMVPPSILTQQANL